MELPGVDAVSPGGQPLLEERPDAIKTWSGSDHLPGRCGVSGRDHGGGTMGWSRDVESASIAQTRHLAR